MNVFDHVALKYDRWYETTLGNFADEVQTDAVFELLEPIQGMKVLDVGCGTGVFSIKLAEFGCKVTGVDISNGMLLLAEEKAETKDLEIDFFNLDATNMNVFSDDSFDCVISVATLEFVNDYKRVFEECMRVLKPGGKLLIGTIQKNSKWGKFYQEKAKKENTIFRFAEFKTKDELLALKPETLVTYKECLFIPPDITEEMINWEEEYRWSQENNGGFIVALWEK